MKKNLKVGEKEPKKEDLVKKIEELDTQLKRALADYCNLSRRTEEKQGEWESKAASRLVDKLLDVYDDLRRAETHLKERGLSMAVSQFWAVLQSEGVEEIKSEGKEFNANSMDCVQVTGGPENKVTETVSKGYLFKGEVIRPAKVKVGKGPGGI